VSERSEAGAGRWSTPPGESKGVALTNWLVNKAAGVLERKSSRRGFILGSAMVGSAVAVAGCAPGTQPGSPYNHITDCGAGSLCQDGYTEFCCTINNGLNTCPSGSFAGGWWRADYSSFCNGTRYYIDCMQYCCGPNRGDGFCAGCTECTCGGGCDTRRIYCNYFRYGQCHQEIGITGPIACRVVTCTPPYNDASLACSTAAAVDNATAEHAPAHGCAQPEPVLPITGAAASTAPGETAVFYRSTNGNIFAFTSSGGPYNGGQIGPSVSSALTAAVDPTGMYVFGRGYGDALWWNRLANGAWSGPQVFGGVPLTSDPCAVTAPNAIYLFARSQNGQLWHGHIDNGVWSDWAPLQGNWTSDVAAVSSTYGVHVFARGTDNQLYARLLSGGSWGPWTGIAGTLRAAPTAVATGNGVYVFIRNADNAIWVRRFNGSWGSWQSLGGQWTGTPTSVVDGAGSVYVLARGTNAAIFCNRLINGSWTGWQSLAGNTNASPIAVSATSSVSVFVRGADNALLTGRFTASGWSGFQSMGGSVGAIDALTA
jgi:hypothetical protein